MVHISHYDPVNWIQQGSWKYTTNRSDIRIKNFWVYSTGYSMKILVFYVDKQYFNMVILFSRLRVRRELIIRRDGRAVDGAGLENQWYRKVPGVRIPLSPLNTKISRKSHKSNICETFLLPFDLSYIFLQVEIIRI